MLQTDRRSPLCDPCKSAQLKAKGVYTLKERQMIWDNSKITYAEIACQYPCCDIPTQNDCDNCEIKCKLNPRKGKN